jgi:hypothetical protein
MASLPPPQTIDEVLNELDQIILTCRTHFGQHGP